MTSNALDAYEAQLSSSRNGTAATAAVHADDVLNTEDILDVAPSMHLSTTFRYPRDSEKLIPAGEQEVSLAPISSLSL